MKGEPNLDPGLFEEGGRRTYYRILTRIPLRCREVGDEEHAALQEEIERDRSEKEMRVDPALVQWLRRIESKLDQILARVDPDAGSPLCEVARQEVVLSAAGVRFPLDHSVEAGSNLLLTFELPGPHMDPVKCLARVVKVEPLDEGPGRFLVAAAFRVLNDFDRDLILAHVMAVQRSELRHRAESGPTS